MKNGSIPHTIEARALAARQVTLEGCLAAAKLPRLAAAVRALEAPAEVVAEFKRDEEGRYVVDLQAAIVVEVACERCLDAMPLAISSSARLGIVWTDEQAQALPSGVEPLLTGDETDLWQVVEDELLLALPAFSYHSDSRCGEATGVAQPDPVRPDETDTPVRDNPFTVLAALKNEPSERS